MPRVHFVKKARKDNEVAKRGESYYWWKFRYGGKRFSKTRPKQSQLTQSPYFATLYDLTDSVNETPCYDNADFEALKESIKDELESLGQECQEKLDNMPDSLQYSPTGELLQERADACENAAMEIDSIDEFEFDNDEDYDEDSDEYAEAEQEQFNDWIDDAKEQLNDLISDCHV